MLPLTIFLYCFLLIVASVVLLLLTAVVHHWYEMRSFGNFPTLYWYTEVIRWSLFRYGNISYTDFVFQTLVQATKRFQKEGLFVVWYGKLYVFIYGEEILKLFLKHPDATDKIPIYNVLQVYLGKGLLTSNGEEWKKQRKTVNPAFHGLSLKDNLDLMNENALLLVNELQDTNESQLEDIMKIIKFAAMRIFFEAVLGKKMNQLKNEKQLKKSIQIVETLSHRVTKKCLLPWLHDDFLRRILIRHDKEDLKVREECKNIFADLLHEKIKSMESSKSSDKTQTEKSESCRSKSKLFSERIIERYMTDPSMTKEDLYDQFGTMTVGGFDTTSHAIMWTLFMLAVYPSVQEEAYNEVMSFNKESPEYEDLFNLRYMECVLKESLRLYPVIPMYGRHLKSDLNYGPYKIPKNTMVNVFLYSVHRNPDIYPDPEKFDPRRFWDDTESHSKLFVPFAEGVRTCVGKNYAMMELKILFFHILKNFRIVSPDRREDIHLSYRIMLSCTKQPRFQFIKRKS